MNDIQPVKQTADMVKTVATAAAATARTITSATAVHQRTDRSHTLLRHATKRPQPTPQAHAHRSSLIRKFADHPKPLTNKAVNYTPASRIAIPQAVSNKDDAATLANSKGTSLKEQLIKERLAEVGGSESQVSLLARIKKTFNERRKSSILTACLAFLLLGGYMAYLNMPNLSVRVASTRAGVTASYPEYHPDGYSFSGPVSYSPGEVLLKFNSNTNSQGYIIKQKSSNWDSQAVLDNHVSKQSSSYLTYSEQGLTIFTYDNKAAWVNGGVLYTLDGDAPLSSEQILNIAASM